MEWETGSAMNRWEDTDARGNNSMEKIKLVALTRHNGQVYVNPNNVVWIEQVGSLTTIHGVDGKTVQVNETVKEVQILLTQ